MNKAIVLLSGGIDSATIFAKAINDGYEVYVITFNYGQKNEIEISSAKNIVNFFKVKNHVIVDIPSELFSRSALIKTSQLTIQKKRDLNSSEIPDTYVPARNILFLAYSLSYGETIGAKHIFIGANNVDYSGYPDCRPEFLESFEQMANIGTKQGVDGDCFRIIAPLINLKKSEIIKLGIKLGVDYSLTHSCYDPYKDGSSCGDCDSCIIRKRGFIEAGVKDPTIYRKNQ